MSDWTSEDGGEHPKGPCNHPGELILVIKLFFGNSHSPHVRWTELTRREAVQRCLGLWSETEGRARSSEGTVDGADAGGGTFLSGHMIRCPRHT